MNQYSRIQRLCDANGISGFEDDVLSVIREEGAHLGRFEEDRLRNLYLHRTGNRGDRPVVHLDAHTDEVGFMVRAIRDDGMLLFIPIGGWVTSNIPAHLVRVIARDGKAYPGVVGSTPPHYISEAERKNAPEYSSLYIDIGASSADEVRALSIGLASPVVPEATLRRLESGLLLGKAFDCRLGCAAILNLLDAVKETELSVDLVAGFASQEEVGLRGAGLSARRIQADVAICFEGSPADDTFLPPFQQQTKVGYGPMLRHIDRTMITNPRFQRFCLEVAKDAGIPVQEGVREGGGTNAGAIHLTAQGIPTIVIGIPVRYAHTHWGVASLEDTENSVRLAQAIIEKLDKETIASF
ncbi:MAG TPA: M42 family metallopeptidase [Sphaerochaeta sp.]|jgi:putative aminopeptidase FrvX|nr:M42 family metallopeptidase [Spirochaetota bacterium]HOE84300.1 M42 family metallopeptidase [Sphaerochaeta sp.]HPK47867.1 M42 family metallopeptidase [Sphaerochaeta sp.]HPY11568.1 M42 family metallopeptidase [Sphaerochaeta sp.]HQB90062.1 M42 family metallopeptidase [Sphaerochaeta sp.]